jgi:hypothetical protein
VLFIGVKQYPLLHNRFEYKGVNMKTKILSLFLLFAIVSMACGVSSLPFVSTATPVVFATAAPATATPPAETPTPTAIPAYMENFNVMSTDWTDPMTLTTQALNGKMYSRVLWDSGQLVFDLQDHETYIYTFYKPPTVADVVLETKVLGAGYIYNGMALICRAAADFSSWYEFRISGTNEFIIMRYDKALKDKEYKNPYVLIKKGGSNAIQAVRDNIMKVTCQGTTLKLEVNGIEIANVQDNVLKDGGQVGVAAMSGELTPVKVSFDYLSIARP